jgi:hypothetical protein
MRPWVMDTATSSTASEMPTIHQGSQGLSFMARATFRESATVPRPAGRAHLQPNPAVTQPDAGAVVTQFESLHRPAPRTPHPARLPAGAAGA